MHAPYIGLPAAFSVSEGAPGGKGSARVGMPGHTGAASPGAPSWAILLALLKLPFHTQPLLLLSHLIVQQGEGPRLVQGARPAIHKVGSRAVLGPMPRNHALERVVDQVEFQ